MIAWNEVVEYLSVIENSLAPEVTFQGKAVQFDYPALLPQINTKLSRYPIIEVQLFFFTYSR